MPDPVSEGEPEGRTDPGGSGLGKKIGPLPLGLWILVGGGVLFGVWWFRSHQTSSAGTSTDPNASLQSGGAPDITTLQGLGQAMQDLASKLGANSISPAPPAPSSSGTVNSDPVRTIIKEVLGTTHTTGGDDTQNVSSSGLPDTSITSRVASVVRSGPSSILKSVTTAPQTTSDNSYRGFFQRVLAVATGNIPGAAPGGMGNLNPTETIPASTTTFSAAPFDTDLKRSERMAG